MMWDKRHRDAVVSSRSGSRTSPTTSTRSASTSSIAIRRNAPTATRSSPGSEPCSRPPTGRRSTRRSTRRRPSSAARRTSPRSASAFATARAGSAVVVRLHGPSGVGKTALARRFLQEARRSGAVVLARPMLRAGVGALQGLRQPRSTPSASSSRNCPRPRPRPCCPATSWRSCGCFPSCAASSRSPARGGASSRPRTRRSCGGGRSRPCESCRRGWPNSTT